MNQLGLVYGAIGTSRLTACPQPAPAAGYARLLHCHLLTGRRAKPVPAVKPRPGRLDLSLALIADGRHDEAAGTALEAITSGRIVPSNSG